MGRGQESGGGEAEAGTTLGPHQGLEARLGGQCMEVGCDVTWRVGVP